MNGLYRQDRNESGWLRTVSVIFLIFALALLFTAPLLAQTATDAELKLIGGLRERRLFRLAELRCNELLSQPALTPTQTTNLTIEKIKTQTAAAILAATEQRESGWQAALATATQFQTDFPNHPRALLIEVQVALTHLSRGQLLRQELAAEMVPESARETALAELRLAGSQFDEIERTITRRLPDHRGRTLTDDELTIDELAALKNNVRFQSAIAGMNRAQLYAANDRLNRLDALSQVLNRLTEVQRETSLGQPLWWDVQIEQVACLRLLGRADEAATLLKRLLATVAEDETAPASLIEQQLRLALDTANEEAALSGLRAAESIQPNSPQLDLARLAVALDFSIRKTGVEKSEWLNRAALLARTMEAEHGPYWGRRAKLVLIAGASPGENSIANAENSLPDTSGNSSGKPNTASSAELDLLIGLAEQAERNERFEDAAKAYDRAADLANKLNAQPQSFTFSVRASQCLEKLGQSELAADRLMALAEKNPGYQFAAAAHLRGLWNLAQVVAKDSNNNPAQQSRFIEQLQSHLKRWPSAESTAQVHVWLGGQLQIQQQWESAFENYVAVPGEHALAGDSMQRAVYCAGRWLESEPSGQQPTIANHVTQQLRLATERADEKLLTSPALIALTEWSILHATLEPSVMLPALSVAVNSDAALPDAAQRGHGWLLALLALEPGRKTEAEQLLKKIVSEKDSALLRLVDAERGLVALAKNYPQRITPVVKQWRLTVIEAAIALLDARASKTSPSESLAWQYRRAEALADLQRDQEALGILQTLEKQFPTDAGIQLQLARSLSRIHATENYEAPLTKWRQLANQLKPHTEHWYEAKYEVALLLKKSGQPDDARKVLEYLQAIPPGWENSNRRDAFESLLRSVQQ